MSNDQNKTFYPRTLCAIVSAAGLAAPLAVQAQAPLAIEEVTVTATRRAMSAQDIPYNISAVSGDDMAARGISDIATLTRSVPGLAYADKGARGGLVSSGLVIRGINAEDARAYKPNLSAPVISTYINDTPVFVNLRLKDIERVEVLRGPQGTLYGSGSLGGTLRFIHRKPELDSLRAQVSGGISQTRNGDGLNYETDAVLNVPLADQWALRINAGQADSAGFIDQPAVYALDSERAPMLADAADPVGSPAVRVSEEGVNASKTRNARIQLLLATDRLEANLAYHYQKSEADGAQQISPGVYGDRLKNAALMLEPFEGEVKLASLDAEYDLGFASLTGSVSDYETEAFGLADSTGLYESFGFYPQYYGGSPRPLVEDHSFWEDRATTAELRLASTGAGDLDWIVGLYYMDQEQVLGIRDWFRGYHDYAEACFAAGNPVGGEPCGYGTFYGIAEMNGPVAIEKDLAFLSSADNRFEDKAVFGELTYHVSEAWQITGGIRWFDQRFESDAVGGLVFAPPSAQLVSGQTATFSESDTLFKFNTSFDLDQDHMLYFTWAEGFRRGGANALPPSAAAGLHTYDADRTENTEIGLKGTVFGSFQYTATLFHIGWDDIQLNTNCTALAIACVINAGAATSRGMEFQIDGRLTERLAIAAGYTHADAQLDSLSDSVSATAFAVRENADLPQTPRHVVSLSLDYEQPLPRGWELVYSLAGNYRSGVDSAITVNNEPAAGFAIWDVGLALNMQRWTLRGFVNNLFDETGITGSEHVDQWGPRARANVSTPRTVGVSAVYHFE